MKELKTYISEGFFSNVGANNIIKPVIDAIKDASLNDEINSKAERLKFADSLTSILKDLESNIKKGKIVFEYTRNGETAEDIMITLKKHALNTTLWPWTFEYSSGRFRWAARDIAFRIANDLYYETTHPPKDSKFRHSIANTIKVTEFKLS